MSSARINPMQEVVESHFCRASHVMIAQGVASKTGPKH